VELLVELPDGVDPHVGEGCGAVDIARELGKDAVGEEGGEAERVGAGVWVDEGDRGDELVDEAGEEEVLGRVAGRSEGGERGCTVACTRHRSA